MEFLCAYCDKVYHHRSSFFKHRQQKHNYDGANYQGKGTVKCQEEGCGASFYRKKNLRNHLSSVHRLPMIQRRLEFESHDDFVQWKQQYEKDNQCAFFVTKGSTTAHNKRTRVYDCSRSGHYISKGTGARALKSQGSSKIGFHCTAGITTTTDMASGKINILLTDTHYGHKQELRHLKLTPTDRMEIGQKLLQGVSVDRILEDVRDSPKSSLERKHLLTRKDIKNVEYSLGRLGIQGHDTEASSVDQVMRMNRGGDEASGPKEASDGSPVRTKHDIQRKMEEIRDVLDKTDDSIEIDDAIVEHLDAVIQIFRCFNGGI